MVGFTGHRKISDPEKIGGVVSRELESLSERIAGELAAVSSVASGGDTLFAEEAIKLGIPWVAILPFPREEFAKDFEPADWERAKQCISKAMIEEIWSPTPDRPGAYHDVGIKTVDECDILFAVWDGGPSGGKGGTADIVEYARRRRKPLVWIHAGDGSVTKEHIDENHLRDPLFDRLLALPDMEIPGPELDGLDYLFRKLDAAASAHIPRVRSLETRIVLFNSVAAFIAAFATAMHYHTLDFVMLTTLLICYTWYLMARLHFPKARHKFVQARLAAEVCRSLRATRDFPDRLTDLYRSFIPESEHMMRSLLVTRDVERARSRKGVAEFNLADFRERYLEGRIRDQHRYYRKHRIHAMPRARRYAWTALIASSAAVLATVILAVIGLRATGFDPFPGSYEFLMRHFYGSRESIPVAAPDSKALALLSITAPLIASFFTALLATNEYGRRSGRYREMEQLLSAADLRLTNATTPRAIKRVVVETEAALLSEAYQWYYHAGL
jgi:hypothetical protein